MTYYRLQDPQYLDSLTDGAQTSMSYSDGEYRSGKSVMTSIEALADYLAQAGVEFTGDWVLVELSGHLSDDEDCDADMGALLVHPTEIHSVEPFEAFMPYLDEACERLGIC